MTEKYQESLALAINSMKIADHMIYVTYPVIKDKRFLLKAMDNIYESMAYTINSMLQYEYLWKRVNLSKDPRENFDSFISKCARRFNISPEETQIILEFFSIVEKHRKSPMEFMRRDKIVILNDNLTTAYIDIIRMKGYLNFAKRIIDKAKVVFGSR